MNLGKGIRSVVTLTIVSLIGSVSHAQSPKRASPAEAILASTMSYPFSSWVENLTQKSPEAAAAGLLIPHGRSMQAYATDEHFPRSIVTIQNIQSGEKEFSIWFGYAAKATHQVEAIVCSPGELACEFFSVGEFEAGKKPEIIAHPQGIGCVSCHQGSVPIWSEGFSETSDNSDVRRQIDEAAKSDFDPIARWTLKLPKPFGSEAWIYLQEDATGDALSVARARTVSAVCEDSQECWASLLCLAASAGKIQDFNAKKIIDQYTVKNWAKASAMTPYSFIDEPSGVFANPSEPRPPVDPTYNLGITPNRLGNKTYVEAKEFMTGQIIAYALNLKFSKPAPSCADFKRMSLEQLRTGFRH